ERKRELPPAAGELRSQAGDPHQAPEMRRASVGDEELRPDLTIDALDAGEKERRVAVPVPRRRGRPGCRRGLYAHAQTTSLHLISSLRPRPRRPSLR
ncbi:unnamed protein product, partial [Urochloa humidicola]